MNMSGLVVLALVVESVVETLKMVWEGGKFNIDRLMSIVVGVALSVYVGLDVISLVGLRDPGLPGVVVTGVLVSRGSNFIHDIVVKFE